MHGRNVTAAREFVVSNLNLNADGQELQRGRVHCSIAEDLLIQINGSQVKNTTLITAGQGSSTLSHHQSAAPVTPFGPHDCRMLILIAFMHNIRPLQPGDRSGSLWSDGFSIGLIGQGFNVNIGAVFLLLLGLGLILAELHSHSFGILAAAA